MRGRIALQKHFLRNPIEEPFSFAAAFGVRARPRAVREAETASPRLRGEGSGEGFFVAFSELISQLHWRPLNRALMLRKKATTIWSALEERCSSQPSPQSSPSRKESRALYGNGTTN